MNKQQAKDLKPILNHWANGGKIASIDYTKTNIDNDDVEEIHWVSLNYLVINDRYVDLRIALKRGETVQLKLNEFYHNVKEDHDFKYALKQYRIEPKDDMSWIDDGVYCRVFESGNVCKITSANREYIFNISGYEGIFSRRDVFKFAEEWKPKEGEVCWFYDNDNDFPYLSKYTETSKDNDVYIHLSESNDMWKKCIPYLCEKFWI